MGLHTSLFCWRKVDICRCHFEALKTSVLGVKDISSGGSRGYFPVSERHFVGLKKSYREYEKVILNSLKDLKELQISKTEKTPNT